MTECTFRDRRGDGGKEGGTNSIFYRDEEILSIFDRRPYRYINIFS